MVVELRAPLSFWPRAVFYDTGSIDVFLHTRGPAVYMQYGLVQRMS